MAAAATVSNAVDILFKDWNPMAFESAAAASAAAATTNLNGTRASIIDSAVIKPLAASPPLHASLPSLLAWPLLPPPPPHIGNSSTSSSSSKRHFA